MKFGSFTELNAWLGDRCRALWDEVRHPEHDQFSVAEMLENERPHLMPMPEWFSVPPAAPHGQAPKLGTLHPSLVRAVQAAFRAATA